MGLFILSLFIVFGEIIWEKIDNKFFYPKREEEYERRKREILGDAYDNCRYFKNR